MQVASPIIAKSSRNEAAEDGLAQLHLASLPKNIPARYRLPASHLGFPLVGAGFGDNLRKSPDPKTAQIRYDPIRQFPLRRPSWLSARDVTQATSQGWRHLGVALSRQQRHGKRVRRDLPVCLVRDFPKEKNAWREVDRLGLLLRINAKHLDSRIRFRALRNIT